MARAILTLIAALAPLVIPVRIEGGGHRDPAAAAIPASGRAFTDEPPSSTSEGSPAASETRGFFGHGARTGFQPSSSPRELVLSFDDGPDLKTTPLVMEELDRRGLKGIFFIAGWRLVGDGVHALARRDLVRKLAAHGHLVGNHTINHKNLCRLSPSDQAHEIDGNTELISHATGLRPLLFRSPYGAICRSLEEALQARDLVDVGWNLDPQDWTGADEDAIHAYLVRKLERLSGRGILLLHDTHPAAVHALGRTLDWIARENHRAVREGRPPIKILDYSVMLPDHPVPATGAESILTDLARPFARLPGAAVARARAGLLAASDGPG